MQYRIKNKSNHALSIGVITAVMSVLMIGSAASVVQAAPGDGYRLNTRYNQNNNSRFNNRSNNNETTTTNRTTPVTPAPIATTTPSTPAVTTPTAPAPQSTPIVAVTPVATAPEPAVVVPPDTAAASTQTAAAQATTTARPVAYTSNKISTELRDRLVMLAISTAITGALLYTITVINFGASGASRVIPIRRIIPVEVINR